MNKRIPLVVVMVALLALLVAGSVAAQRSSQYGLSWSIVAGGGGASRSASYGVSGTAGQPAAGLLASANYRLSGGFWAGLAGAPPAGQFTLYLPVLLKG